MGQTLSFSKHCLMRFIRVAAPGVEASLCASVPLWLNPYFRLYFPRRSWRPWRETSRRPADGGPAGRSAAQYGPSAAGPADEPLPRRRTGRMANPPGRTEQRIEQAYSLAREQYAELGVDADAAMDRLSRVPVSLHCWQGDDVGGFEQTGSALGGGLAVTGSYPGKARSPDELRADLDKALSLIPGRHRLNLHAMYAETGGRRVDRDAVEPEHFRRWIDWAKG